MDADEYKTTETRRKMPRSTEKTNTKYGPQMNTDGAQIIQNAMSIMLLNVG